MPTSRLNALRVLQVMSRIQCKITCVFAICSGKFLCSFVVFYFSPYTFHTVYFANTWVRTWPSVNKQRNTTKYRSKKVTDSEKKLYMFVNFIT